MKPFSVISLSLLAIILACDAAHSQENLPTRTIDRYTLILFNFDSDEAGSLNDTILKTYLYNSIEEGARIQVTGYSDVVGLEDRNLQLSKKRARTVDERIKKNVSDSTIASLNSDGVGETQPLYSNDLPEGRFYNRTVQIVVENTVESE